MAPPIRPVPSVYDIKPDALISNGVRLFEVVEIHGEWVTVRNCVTEHTHDEELVDVLEEPWFIVRAPEDRR